MNQKSTNHGLVNDSGNNYFETLGITKDVTSLNVPSALAMKGVPMGVIAAQLGHSNTRMTEKHYAHLAPSYVANSYALSIFGLTTWPRFNCEAR